MNSSTRVHLVLGAGGVKTLSYPAAIEELCSAGIDIATVSAASGGSFFGALLAAGIGPGQIQEEVEKFDLETLAGKKRRLAWFPYLGAMWRWPFARYQESGLPGKFVDLVGRDLTFGELEFPYATIGLDIVTRRLLVYSTWTTPDMRVSEALRIAIAVPFLYAPSRRGARLIVDGALASPYPVWLATEQPESLPIVVLRPRRPVAREAPGNGLELLGQLLDLGGASRDAYAINQMSQKVIVDIDVGDVLFNDFKLTQGKRDRLALGGRRAARDALPAIMAVANGSFRQEPVASTARSLDNASDDDRAEAGGASAMASFNANLSRRIRDRVFISYAREDEKWRERLEAALVPFVRPPNAIWSDKDIKPGARWMNEIDEALQKTKVAVLLVTTSFLASEFIRDVELPKFVSAAEQGGLALLWVAVGDSGYGETPLKDYQAANDPTRPLKGLTDAEVDEAMVTIGKQVKMGLT